MATQPEVDGGGSLAENDEEGWKPEQGPIPYERLKPIVENTRSKAHAQGEHAGRQAALQEVQQQYGWALQLGPERAQVLNTLGQQLVSDPVGFLDRALNDLSRHPEYAPQVRSLIARTLATRGGNGNGQGYADPALADPEPQADLQLEGGYVIYSAEQQREHQAWRERQFTNNLLGQIRQELTPLQRDIQQRQERDTIAAATHQANEFARGTLAEMSKLPFFTEQKAEIEKVFRAMPAMEDHQVGQAIRDAYIQVMATKVLPHLDARTRANTLSTLNTKAAASARNPASGSVAVARRPTSFQEALELAEQGQRR